MGAEETASARRIADPRAPVTAEGGRGYKRRPPMAARRPKSVAPIASSRARYSPHPALAMEATAKAKLLTTSGRSFEQWVALARRAGAAGHRDLKRWLHDEHGLGSRTAWWIASAALGVDEPDYTAPEQLVDALYAGPRAALRALHERLVDEFLALGDDVIVTACKTMVPVYRKFVFAELHPVRDGVEVQLALGETPVGRRLVRAKGRVADDRITHAVLVEHEDAIDELLRDWFRAAYAAGAKRVLRSAAIDVPDTLVTALRRSKAATATWQTLTPAMQRAFVTWIGDAKQEATRAKRVALAIEKLAAGHRKVY